MGNTFYKIPEPYNEPIIDYFPGSKQRGRLKAELERQYNREIEIPLIIGGQNIRTGNTGVVVCPHEHGHVLAVYHKAGEREAGLAIEAAMESRQTWISLDWSQRAAIFLKMADLISTKYRYILNAATMLGQSKTAYQAEIEAAEVFDMNPLEDDLKP